MSILVVFSKTDFVAKPVIIGAISSRSMIAIETLIVSVLYPWSVATTEIE